MSDRTKFDIAFGLLAIALGAYLGVTSDDGWMRGAGAILMLQGVINIMLPRGES